MIKTSRYDILESDFEGNDIMANLHIDFTKIINKIKPMHAVGQPPFRGGFQKLDFSPMQILKDANIPYSRLHDVGGAFGGYRYVDIPNIFRNFDADETKPESYDFAFTDALLAGMAQYGIKPYFRLGVTIENQSFIKAYHIHPPKIMKNGHAYVSILSDTTMKDGQTDITTVLNIGKYGMNPTTAPIRS